MSRAALTLGTWLAFAGAATRAAGAQDTAVVHTARWLSIGVGLGYLEQSADFGAHLEATYQFGPNVVAVRVASAASILGAVVSAISGQGQETAASDVGLFYERATRPRVWHMAAAAGGGIATVARDSAGMSLSSRHFTIPVEAQAALRPAEGLGVVLCAFASLNSRRTFGGATLGLQLGRLR